MTNKIKILWCIAEVFQLILVVLLIFAEPVLCHSPIALADLVSVSIYLLCFVAIKSIEEYMQRIAKVIMLLVWSLVSRQNNIIFCIPFMNCNCMHITFTNKCIFLVGLWVLFFWKFPQYVPPSQYIRTRMCSKNHRSFQISWVTYVRFSNIFSVMLDPSEIRNTELTFSDSISIIKHLAAIQQAGN